MNLQVHAGEEYVQAISAQRSDRRARDAFRELTLGIAAPGSRIFDFGAGPGTDALFFADHGFDVAAYDHDSRMCESFRQRCRPHLEAGRIRLQEGTYQDFLAAPSPFAGSIDVITANFAPFSMIAELRPLFAKLHQLSRPGARIVTNVLNPYFAHDARYREWWGCRLELMRRGEYLRATGPTPVHLRAPRVLAASAAPWFRLVRWQRGLPVDGIWQLPGIARLGALTSRFLFLVFARNELATGGGPVSTPGSRSAATG